MDPPLQRPRRFRFSLREALLATVALCAVVALFVKNRPHGPTDFLLAINERALLTQCCKELGVPLDLGGSSAGTGQSNDGSERQCSFMIRAPSIDEFQADVMPAFHSRIGRLLAESGCDIDSRSKGGSEKFKKLQEFAFRYRQGVTRGVIRVYSVDGHDGESRLLVVIDEW